jgi:hypothetical protein
LEASAFEEEPAGQRTHTVDPLLALKPPAAQAWHADALLAASVFEEEPMGQSVHTVEPLLAE